MICCYFKKVLRKKLKEIVPSVAGGTIVKISNKFSNIHGSKTKIQNHFHILQF
jgi:hypothetical protein